MIVATVARTHADPLNRNDEKMRYRPLGRTGLEVSALAFGCMRLKDDLELNKELLGKAVDLGVNYFESTRHYLGGTCQHRVAGGLDGRTKGIIISGKEGLDQNKSAYLFRKEIERQLDILGIDHFKFFQVGWFSWGKMKHLLKRGGVLDALRRAQDEGLIRYIGFTGHDTPENFIKCIETGLFDSITVPYNMVNRSYEPTIKRAGELGVGVIAMCALAGGMLAETSEELREAIGVELPTAELALRFILSNPDVSCACSGMITVEDLEQNVRTVKDFDPASADHAQMCEGLDRMREKLGEKFCTNCKYCMECPQGVAIPRHLSIWNNWKTWGLEKWAVEALGRIPEAKWAAECNECGECEDKCPNDLSIRERLKELRALRG
jgi:predicted aldo/keto reductase-like oxidoreductase